ncbi:MAG: glycoside hydrolase family 38 C-terminal domain-containing protein [Ignavibacteria bacterium]|nr:glycoside hydrolase family 38 C-terminal domain-containing protein [Ignavibacteria bacterium]
MKPTYHIVSHSHWDREWYFPFDRFRAMLVDMIEDLFELLEKDPEFKSYTLDGQMAAVMDFLETRPDRVETIRRLVEEKRLFIGPWYILNDEFLSSGEAHIRNLSLGFRLGKRLGGVMRVGYIPDQFGHIAQMPQILHGFGIDTALIYRGFGGEPGQEPSEYWWVSPDGTRVLMHHLPRDGYSAGYFGTQDGKVILQKFERMRTELDARATTSQRLFFNGGDHHWPDENVTTAIRHLRAHHEAEFKHSNFPDFLDAVKKETASGDKLTRLEGETRFGYRHAFAVLGGVFSSRMYIKQLNAECETLLERYLEPLNVLAVTTGMRSRTPQIEQAWKYVLQNQDHDAICGTSVDAVHREMVVRYSKVQQIGEHVKTECLARLLPYNEQEYRDDRFVFVFNPSPFTRSEMVETEIEFFLQDIVVGLNPEVIVDDKQPPVKGFTILDPRGNEVPYQILKRQEDFGVTYSKHDYPHQTLVDRFSVILSADTLPAVGWKGLNIIKTEEMPRYPSEVRTGSDFIENDFVKAEVVKDGRVRLTDKATGATYEGINFFEDSGDVGDEYNYSYPERDEWILSDQHRVHVTLEENGPLRGALRIDHRMMVPVSASQDEKSRSTEKGELKISSVLILTRFSKRVDIKTTVHNTIRDHRLRALFDTGIKTNESFADTPFAVVKRKHQSYDTTQFSIEHPAMVAPMKRFVTVRDEQKSFTLMVKGLPEYELKLDQPGVLALTLLRCVGKLSGRDLITRPGGAAGWWNETPDAQCLGKHTFEYSVFPGSAQDASDWSSILKEVELFTVPPLAVNRKNDQSALEQGFISITPDSLTLSTLKVADEEKGIVVRLSNPVDRTVEGIVHFEPKVKEVFRAKMNEEKIEAIVVSNGYDIHVTVKPYEVVTLLISI